MTARIPRRALRMPLLAITLALGACCDRDAATADADGRYSVLLGSWGRRFDTCLLAGAEPAAGSAFGTDSTTRDSMRVGGATLDSPLLDFTLPPGA